MRMKRTFFGILILSFLLNLATIAPASAQSDFSGEDNFKSVMVLYGLGIFNENDNIELSQNVTRAQFAMYLTRLMNADAKDCTETEFSDVLADNPYIAYIRYVTENKIMAGYTATKFLPEAEITFGECIRIFLDLMGYSVYAQTNGGYSSVASSLKLNSKGKGETDKITAEELALLLERVFDVDMIKYDSDGGRKELSVQNDCTLLNQYLNIYKDKGIVKAVGNVALDGKIGLGENECLIDSYLYSAGSSDIENYLGYYVDFYYRENNGGENTIVAVIPNDKNSTLKIQQRDILSTSNYMSLDYQTENKRRVARIDSDAYVLYNGCAIAPADRTQDMLRFLTPADEAPQEGEINLIDYDGDGSYDVLDIRAGYVVVVDRVDSVSHAIYDKMNPARVTDVNPESSFDKIVLLKNGAEINLSDINEWDTLVVEDSYYDNNKVRTIKVSSTSISGYVRSVNSSENEITVGDKVYPISESYLYAKKNNTQTFGVFDKGSIEGVFCLDIYGNVVAAMVGATGGGYGYLINYIPSEDSNDEQILLFRIIGMDGKLLKLQGNNKVRVTTFDESGTQKSSRYSGMAEISPVLPSNQIIQYVTDEENHVKEITVPKMVSVSDGSAYTTVMKSKNNGAFVGTQQTALNYTDDNVKTFESKFYIDDGTKLLLASNDRKSESDFVWLTSKYLSNAKQYNVEAYDVDDFMYAPLIVVYQDSAASNIDSAVSVADFMLVEETHEKFDDSGEIVTEIIGVQEGAQKTLTIKDTSKLYDLRPNMMAADKNNPILFAELKRGDIIQYYESGYNTIEEALRIFKADDKQTYKNATSVSHQEKTLIYGQVVKIDRANSFVVININPPESKEQNLWVLDMKYSSFMLWEDKLVKGASFGDIRVGDYLFVRDQWSRVHNTAIIRFEK